MGLMKLDGQQLHRVANFFRAFAEPTRLAILQELKEGELRIVIDLERTHQSIKVDGDWRKPVDGARVRRLAERLGKA